MKRSMRWAGLVAMIGISLLMLGGCKLFNAPPVANFSWTPSDPIARTDIQFTDDSTDEGGLFGGGGVTAWQWDFGDSGSSAAQNPQHRYTKGGTYTVRLTVTDASGEQSSKTKTIVVNPSLNGTWTGFFDDGANRLTMTLVINHSATGGMGGSVNVVVQNFTIQSGSLAGDQVTLTCLGGLVLEGTLSASQTSMSGWWTIFGNPGWTWSVTLAG